MLSELYHVVVRTSYFPLKETENGNFHLNHEVKNPKPNRDFIKMVKKFSHFTEVDIEEFQRVVDRGYDLVN